MVSPSCNITSYSGTYEPGWPENRAPVLPAVCVQRLHPVLTERAHSAGAAAYPVFRPVKSKPDAKAKKRGRTKACPRFYQGDCS